MKVRGAPTAKWPANRGSVTDEEAPGDPTRSRARLTVRRPNVPEVEIPLEKPEFIIGRQTVEVDLTLDDDLVSRKHARLTVDVRGYFKLEDLGSRNGITFGGRNVRRLNLIDGDVFSIGKAEFVFHAAMVRFEKKPEPPPAPNDELSVQVPTPEPESFADEQAEPSPPQPQAAAETPPEGPNHDDAHPDARE